jgi:phospholipid/cholesterol/gamma-HCH transport system substrate-binding protein
MASAAKVQWAKFRVTAVSLAALIILCTLLYALFGAALFAPKTEVYLYVPDGSGLSGDSPVRVDGIDVGKVSKVELSGTNQPGRVVRVTLSLHRDRLGTIPADSVTQISSDSLIGDKFVDITSGTSPSGVLPGAEITYKDQPELVRSLDLAQFTQQLRLVDATLTDIEEGRSEFGKFYQGTEFYDGLEKQLTDLQKAFEASVATTTMVGALLNTDQLHRQLTDLIATLDQTIAKIQAGQGPAGQLLRNPAQYNELMATVHSLRQSLEAVGASPLMQSDDAYGNANRFLVAMIQSVDELNRNPQLATTAVYDNLNGSLKQLQETIKDFRSNPKKYLRLKVF